VKSYCDDNDDDDGDDDDDDDDDEDDDDDVVADTDSGVGDYVAFVRPRDELTQA